MLLLPLNALTPGLTPNLAIAPNSSSAQSAPPPPIWPTLQHDYQRTSLSSFAGPTANKTDWLFGPTGAIKSSPVIGSDGTIYFVDSNFHLFAINRDGSLKWEKTFTEGVFSPAIGPSGTIYVPGTRHLFAFNPDGSSPWQVPANISTSRNAALVVSTTGILFEIDSNGTLHAINPFNAVATSVWTISLGCVPTTLALGPSGSLYCGTGSNGTTAALDSVTSNGKLQWSFPTKSSVLVAPAIDSNGNIYVVSSGGEIFGLGSLGNQLWSISNIHQEVTSAVIGPNSTIFVAGDKLAAISESGIELWSEICYLASSSLCYPYGTTTSMAVDSSGNLYVGTNSSGLIELNSAGGLIWAYNNLPSGEGSLSPLAIGSNGTMYFGTGCQYCNVTSFGHLIAVGQPSGYSTFTVSQSGLPIGNPWSFVVNGRNYTTSGSSLLFSLPSASYSWDSPPSAVPNTVGVRYGPSIMQGSFTVPSTLSISLSFSVQYQINFTASPAVGGNVGVATGLWYAPGSVVQMNAAAAVGYHFGIWSTSSSLIGLTNSSDPRTAMSINGPGTIFGIFDPLVTVSAGNGGSVVYLDPPYVGTLKPGQSVSFYAPSESIIVLVAHPSSGFSFQNWNGSSQTGIDVSSANLEFKITSPTVLAAEFVTATVSSSITISSQTSVTTVFSSTTSTVPQVVSIPETSVLPTRNVGLDIAIAIIVALIVALGVVVLLGIGSLRKVA